MCQSSRKIAKQNNKKKCTSLVKSDRARKVFLGIQTRVERRKEEQIQSNMLDSPNDEPKTHILGRFPYIIVLDRQSLSSMSMNNEHA